MAKNTFKTKPVEKKEKRSGFSVWLARFFNIEDLVMGLPSHYLYYGLWLFFLTISYIFFSHKYENYIREIEKLKVQIDEKRPNNYYCRVSVNTKIVIPNSIKKSRLKHSLN